jgi:hypothetical protein
MQKYLLRCSEQFQQNQQQVVRLSILHEEGDALAPTAAEHGALTTSTPSAAATAATVP